MNTQLYANLPEMALNQPADWIARPIRATQQQFHRQFLVISGSADWAVQEASIIVDALPHAARTCWIGDTTPSVTAINVLSSYQHFRDVLGEEFDVAIMDASAQFRLSVLAALAGTVRSGGTVILLCPPIKEWPTAPGILAPYFLSYGASICRSRYVPFLIDRLLANHQVGWHTQERSRLPATTDVSLESSVSRHAPFRLSPQQTAVFNMVTQQDIHSLQCSCIVAKRGRGKSTLVGTIAQHLMSQGMRVCLTSPSQRSVATLMHHANILTPDSSKLGWKALDNPILVEGQHHVLIVDEAAAIPLPVLRTLIASNKFTLLSTTTDGYEGSGQGFRNKFLEPENITVRTLSEPVRWAAEDPVEALINQLTFSSYLPSIKPDPRATLSGMTYQCLPASELSNTQLVQLMTLLSGAHYQSSPDDLVRLSDSPDTTFHLVRIGNDIIAAAAVEAEGGNRLSPLADDISSGKRRVKGHLTAQSLALMSASPEVAVFKIRRINRIAVLPAWQNSGLGSQLLSNLKDHYRRQEEIDLLTSSFGADTRLMHFWRKSAFTTVKRGRKADKASGLTSVLVISPLSPRAAATMNHLIELENTPATSGRFRHKHVLRLKQFADGRRSADHLYSSSRWAIRHCPDTRLIACLEDLDEGLNPAEVASKHDFTGKKSMLAWCREHINAWLNTQ